MQKLHCHICRPKKTSSDGMVTTDTFLWSSVHILSTFLFSFAGTDFSWTRNKIFRFFGTKLILNSNFFLSSSVWAESSYFCIILHVWKVNGLHLPKGMFKVVVKCRQKKSHCVLRFSYCVHFHILWRQQILSPSSRQQACAKLWSCPPPQQGAFCYCLRMVCTSVCFVGYKRKCCAIGLQRHTTLSFVDSISANLKMHFQKLLQTFITVINFITIRAKKKRSIPINANPWKSRNLHCKNKYDAAVVASELKILINAPNLR